MLTHSYRYPEAKVIGTDISPIQPNWVPQNCRFVVDDAEQTFSYKNDKFDLVHLRNLSQCIDDWDKLLAEVYRCTKPGGYAEMDEMGSEFSSRKQ